MKRGRKKKFITVRVYIRDEEIYIDGNRVNELKEIKILSLLREDIYKYKEEVNHDKIQS